MAIDEDLQAMIVKSQSRRLDDQRTPDPQEEVFMSLVARLQGARMDDQRASLHLEQIVDEEYEKPQTEDEFVELLFRCQVRSGLVMYPLTTRLNRGNSDHSIHLQYVQDVNRTFFFINRVHVSMISGHQILKLTEGT